jgi:hypothetical protein
MAANVLVLNSDKTEMLVLGPKKQIYLLFDLTINLNGYTLISNKAEGSLISLLTKHFQEQFFHLGNI